MHTISFVGIVPYEKKTSGILKVSNSVTCSVIVKRKFKLFPHSSESGTSRSSHNHLDCSARASGSVSDVLARLYVNETHTDLPRDGTGLETVVRQKADGDLLRSVERQDVRKTGMMNTASGAY